MWYNFLPVLHGELVSLLPHELNCEEGVGFNSVWLINYLWAAAGGLITQYEHINMYDAVIREILMHPYAQLLNFPASCSMVVELTTHPCTNYA